MTNYIPFMKRSSSKESLNDYFWDDLDETSGEQIEKSILSLLTKSRAVQDNEGKLQSESASDFVASQDLDQMQGRGTSDVGTAHDFGGAASDGDVIAESPSCEVSADNEGMVYKLDKASMEELLYGDDASGMKEPAQEAAGVLAQEHVAVEKEENENTSFPSTTMEAKQKTVGPSEDNNELPNSFWGNEEDGTDFETKLSLLALNAKSERDSEYSSLLSKLSTDAFLCSMSEASRGTQDAGGAKESKLSPPSNLEKKHLAKPAAAHDQNTEREQKAQTKDGRDGVGEEVRGNIAGLKTKVAEKTHDKGNAHSAASEREVLIPKSGSMDSVPDDSGFNFGEYPRIVYLQGRQLVAHPTKQKRLDIKSGTEREFVSTLFTFFTLDYNLPSIVDLNCAPIVESEPMLSILFSKDVTIDRIVDVLGVERVKYVVSDIGNAEGDANELVEMFFLNREVAIKHALACRQWALALFLSHNTRHQDEVIKEFSMHLNPILHPFFMCGEMSDNWKQTFSLLLRNPQNHLIDMLISRAHGVELLHAVLSFYFIHSRQFSSRLLFNNFYFLKLALRYGIEPENLDMLILRYLRVMQEEGKEDVSKVYNKYKGRKGVSKWEPKKSWLEGIRSAVEKGISRIVGVDEDTVQQGGCREDARSRLPDNQRAGIGQNSEHGHYEHRSVHFSEHARSEDRTFHALESGQHKSTYSHDKQQRTKYLQQAEAGANDANAAGHLYYQGTSPSAGEKMESKHVDTAADAEALQSSAVLHKEEAESGTCLPKAQEASKYSSAGTGAEQHAPKACGSVYRSDMRSQSCADLRSLVPADILQEDDAPERNAKKEDEKKPGFFSRFSLFSRKKTYKVNLNTSEDFRYDPATKKWTGSSSPHESPSSPVPVKKEAPRPAMASAKKISIALDGSIKSRYTNNVNVEGEKSSLASLLPRKK